MPIRLVAVFVYFLVINNSLAQDFAAGTGISSFIRNTMGSTNPETRLKVGDLELFSSVVIYKFYQEREFEPAWISKNKLTELAYEMRYELLQAKYDGLNPVDYHLDRIQSYFTTIEANPINLQNNDLAALDILLTDAYIMLSSHIFLGKVDPEQLKATWNIQRSAPELYIDQRLTVALENQNIRKSLEQLYPSFSIYKRMRDGLRELFEVHDRFLVAPVASWKKIKSDKSIKQFESNNSIPEVRDRLIFWNYIVPYPTENEKLYDSIMEHGIKKIQYRNGLEPDGVIGQGTIYALNQTPEDLIKTASVNLERLRWLPDSLKEQELILVNTANFQLDFIQKRDTVFTSKVIVGKSYHATPQFSSEMSYIVFSPTWTVPYSIVKNEIIPAIKKDHQYLAKKNMKLLTSSGSEVNPASIDWSKVNARSFPYTVRQEPGQQNSLGLVKFMFPNKHSVYIHDTPSRSLFAREDRALSHGCIRIEKPFDLAKYLLAFDKNWDDKKINDAMHLSKEKTVMLNRKIPVVILYLTYWSDSAGNNFYFRRDIYSRDEEIYQALNQKRKQVSGI